jgi:hypothetical protein
MASPFASFLVALRAVEGLLEQSFEHGLGTPGRCMHVGLRDLVVEKER